MQRYIYLMLSSSSSAPAKLIKFFTKNRYNHASISLDDSLTSMYSFGRTRINNPLSGGFVNEHKDRGFYQRFRDTYIALYRFPVSEETYLRTRQYLNWFCENKDKMHYNYMGLVGTYFKIPVEKENTYFCSQFVAKVFQECQIREIRRDIRTYCPFYFEELSDKEMIYEGPLAEYMPKVDRIKARYNFTALLLYEYQIYVILKKKEVAV